MTESAVCPSGKSWGKDLNLPVLSAQSLITSLHLSDFKYFWRADGISKFQQRREQEPFQLR